MNIISENTEDIYNIIVRVLQQEFDINPEDVSFKTDLVSDLGVDSLDILDMVCLVERELNIRIPINEWITSANQNADTNSNYFEVDHLCTKIQEIREAS